MRHFCSNQEKHHRRIAVTENYTLTGLYPNTLYYVWLAARSQRGEGATTIPYPVRTKQYGKQNAHECIQNRMSSCSEECQTHADTRLSRGREAVGYTRYPKHRGDLE